MTVGVFIVHDNGIEIFSDGAAYDDAGIFGEYSNKVRTAPHLSAFAFAWGSGNAARLVKDKLVHLETFEMMIEQLDNCVELSMAEARLIYGDHVNLGAVIGGYSEKSQEWQLWYSAISQPLNEELQYYKLRKLGSFFANNYPSEAKLAEFGFGSFDAFKWDYEVADGIRFMEAVRQSPDRLHAHNEVIGCFCGGFIERTIIERDAAYSQIVHRWPDKIGEVMGINEAEADAA